MQRASFGDHLADLSSSPPVLAATPLAYPEPHLPCVLVAVIPRPWGSRLGTQCKHTSEPRSYVKLLVPGVPRVAEGKLQPSGSCPSGSPALAQRARRLRHFHVQVLLWPFHSRRTGRGCSRPRAPSSVVLGLCEARLTCRFSLYWHTFCAKNRSFPAVSMAL